MPSNSPQFDFDGQIARRGTNSEKWDQYPEDVLPLFVADMDFPAPPPVLAALRRRLEHGVLGYTHDCNDFAQVLCEQLARRYDWVLEPDCVLPLPGLVCGLNLVCRAIGGPGDAVLVLTPIYPRFLPAPRNQGRELVTVELAPEQRGDHLHYRLDLDAIEAAVVAKRPRLLLLCSPHNPTGRVFSRAELTALAELCERYDLVICSDEIHCDLLLGDRAHVPTAILGLEVEARTITLLAPSKTYNLPGLRVSGAVATNPELRARLKREIRGLIPTPNVLGLDAAVAAYREGGPWLAAVLDYLRANRDYVAEFAARHLPGIGSTLPEATYLTWLDCRQTAIGDDPCRFFLDHARVALSDGRNFGPGGDGFVRLNFACNRATLRAALERMAEALP